MKKRAVFLDRDGVLSKKLMAQEYVLFLDELKKRLLPNIQEPLKRLRIYGYLLIIVTNQSAINKGLITQEEYSKMVAYLKTLGISDVYTCPHNPLKEFCSCRKPFPGMLKKAAVDYDIDLESSWLIGDELTDIQAGNSAGCKTIHVLTGEYKEPVKESDFVANSLIEAADYIITEDANK